MSSYFDKQYGGDDDNNSISSSSEKEDLEEDEDAVDNDDEDAVDDDDDDEDAVDDDEDAVDDDEDAVDDLEEDDDDDLEGGAPEDIESGEIDEEAEEIEKKAKRTKKVPSKNIYKKPISIQDDDDDESDDDGELYLQKFDKSLNDNYILNFHPECALQNYDEILSMIVVIRDKNGIIVDDLHKTIPYLTKYEKARILGQRAKQINSGSPPFVKVPENVIDGYIIAELELKEKKIPFIIRRPLPNGGSEYWSLKDLEDISF
jgi:DNA-directed RNA polymerase subunit K/omega